ncbi:YihY/virulence factor BrkB family protein [Lacticaseibacillus zhaodongensis]|uniref:YihY/virulence factor BrkB family protein n=1 Tax=Lacticaseibacillus zhaodongensis TaxID=2668065 RepID=UPI0012D2F2AD|nr:YihY/virulence factor BrkB family protein [Lacticaseibacillus zhaodongensis]
MTKWQQLRARISNITKRVKMADQDDKPLATAAATPRVKAAVVFRRGIAVYGDAEVSSRAASVTYYAVLSMFPLLITIGNLLPFFGLRYDSVVAYLGQVVPASIMTLLNPIIRNLIDSSGGGILSIGALATLWTASMGINELKNGFNRIYGVKPKQNALVRRVLAMLLMMIVVIALVGVMLAFTFGTQLLEWLVRHLGLSVQWLQAFNALRWPVTVVALVVALCLIYYFLPNASVRFRTVIWGSLFATVTLIAVAQLFSLYMRFFGTSYSSYGAIGSFMVLLLWLDLSASLFLIGAVINAEVAEYFDGDVERSASRFLDLIRRKRRAEQNKSS